MTSAQKLGSIAVCSLEVLALSSSGAGTTHGVFLDGRGRDRNRGRAEFSTLHTVKSTFTRGAQKGHRRSCEPNPKFRRTFASVCCLRRCHCKRRLLCILRRRRQRHPIAIAIVLCVFRFPYWVCIRLPGYDDRTCPAEFIERQPQLQRFMYGKRKG